MSLIWRDQCKLFNKRQRKSSLKHPVQLARGLTIYLTDEGLQQWRIVQWIEAHGLTKIHVPNESKRHRLEGITLRLLGMSSGYPDLTIFDTPPKYPDKKGFCLEVKADKGKVTSNQLEWKKKLEEQGWLTGICYGAEMGIKMLKEAGYALNCRCPYCRD